MLIGHIILDDRMTGHNYLGFLQNGLPEQIENVPLATQGFVYFQHGGAPSHYTCFVMQHQSDTFPNQWIRCGSTINWPPKSPELTSLEFYLWVWVKSKVYRRKAET
jgi:hypothetical protein